MRFRFFFLLAASTLLVGCPQQPAAPPNKEFAPPNPAPVVDQAKNLYEKTREKGEELLKSGTNSVQEVIRDLYEKAKEAGEQVPTNVVEWTKKDIKSIGAWEYRIEELDPADSKALEKRLNEFGADRWEVFWVDRSGPKAVFYMKKSGRSYLRNIPFGQLIKFTTGDGGDAPD